MAVWTPGSYLVREFSRHVEDVTVEGFGVVKTHKNRWRASPGGASEIRLSYRVYCREMSVRTNWVEASFALLNGAATFLARADTDDPAVDMSYEVRVELPSGWKITASGMDEIGPHCYTAANYDVLVDSPIVAGNPDVYSFDVDGVPHSLVNVNEEGVWHGPQSAADAEKVVRQYRETWGPLLYRKYVFLNLLTEAGGGLEHRPSAAGARRRFDARRPHPRHHLSEARSGRRRFGRHDRACLAREPRAGPGCDPGGASA